MTLNQKTIDAINKAKQVVAVRDELIAERNRMAGKEYTQEMHEQMQNVYGRMRCIEIDLANLQSTILIELEVA